MGGGSVSLGALPSSPLRAASQPCLFHPLTSAAPPSGMTSSFCPAAPSSLLAQCQQLGPVPPNTSLPPTPSLPSEPDSKAPGPLAGVGSTSDLASWELGRSLAFSYSQLLQSPGRLQPPFNLCWAWVGRFSLSGKSHWTRTCSCSPPYPQVSS